MPAFDGAKRIIRHLIDRVDQAILSLSRYVSDRQRMVTKNWDIHVDK